MLQKTKSKSAQNEDFKKRGGKRMKNKMKRLLSIMLVVAMMAMLVVGCSGKSSSSDSDEGGEAKTEEKETFKVGYANKTLNNPYFVALDQKLKEETEALG